MNELINKKKWRLTRTVLPQHTDHAGVLWHGSYFNFLEEARIDALHQVGITYSDLSKQGYEIPLISSQIKYKIPFRHGEKVLLESQFNFKNKIRLNCKTSFLKVTGEIGAEAQIELVFVRKKNDSLKLVRELPREIKNILLLLEEGLKV